MLSLAGFKRIPTSDQVDTENECKKMEGVIRLYVSFLTIHPAVSLVRLSPTPGKFMVKDGGQLCTGIKGRRFLLPTFIAPYASNVYP
jgi:hypothetical protein